MVKIGRYGNFHHSRAWLILIPIVMSRFRLRRKRSEFLGMRKPQYRCGGDRDFSVTGGKVEQETQRAIDLLRPLRSSVGLRD
jgi:hypothetical protein